MNYLIFSVRAALIVVFIAAVYGKVHSRSAWSAFTSGSAALLGVRRGRTLLAIAVVLSETVTAVCLSIDQTAYFGLLLALALLLSFLIVVITGVSRQVPTACNCFGADGEPLTHSHVWRNVLLVLVAMSGAVVASISRNPPFLIDTSYATPLVLSLGAAAAFVMWDDVWFLIFGGSADDA